MLINLICTKSLSAFCMNPLCAFRVIPLCAPLREIETKNETYEIFSHKLLGWVLAKTAKKNRKETAKMKCLSTSFARNLSLRPSRDKIFAVFAWNRNKKWNIRNILSQTFGMGVLAKTAKKNRKETAKMKCLSTSFALNHFQPFAWTLFAPFAWYPFAPLCVK